MSIKISFNSFKKDQIIQISTNDISLKFLQAKLLAIFFAYT